MKKTGTRKDAPHSNATGVEMPFPLLMARTKDEDLTLSEAPISTGGLTKKHERQGFDLQP